MRTDEPYELIFVDNGSTDGTIEFLESLQNSTLIRNATNLGFPAAVNQGLEFSRGETILLLNNDTIVTTGWLRRMLDVLYGSDAIGLVGPLSNNVSGPQQVDADFEHLADLDGSVWDRHARFATAEIVDVDRLVGFCLLIKRSVLEDVGPLDERFGIGCFEDDDFCRRARSDGYRAVIATNAFVHHFGSVTFQATGIDFARLMSENEQQFHDKWATDSTRVNGQSPVQGSPWRGCGRA